MRTNNITKGFVIAAAGLLLTACQDQLEETNTNPNEAIKAQPEYLLANAIKSNADLTLGSDASMETTTLFIQHWAKIQYTDPDKYTVSIANVQNVWTNLYSQGLTDFATLIKLGEETGNTNYQAVGLILKSWSFQLLTDLYGNIPYSEALKLNETLTPKYDSQKDVYLGLLNDLKKATELINTGGSPISGDLVYNGNLTKWKKFANSLRLRIALRIADKEPETAKAVVTELAKDKSALIASNDEIAQLVYLASPNQNPVSRDRETRDDYRVSKSIIDKLQELKDPRLAVFANKTVDATPTGYIGVTNGLPADSAAKLGFTKTSKLGDYFTAAASPAVFVSYAEVLFNLAEAAQRGYIAENAADLYKAAVTASLQQFKVSNADIATYLAQPSVSYNAANYKKSIGEQKWLALFSQGLEAFAEWRRLDYPQLKPAYAGVLNGKLPLRLTYPTGEQALNAANYKAAVAAQGEDRLTTRLWFDAF
ncbi:SusD/RagB family nutrient-binding outer membrane lipoprotein [Dyadobacter jiangsuensis]|uniref:SusD-like starch-binding protein associating with outer membrane n=1 Tax=Dyadobacter jiangsuensis TaxID=1591085 RepID=A0A2P8G1U9_9BACT|nr:SusD/RagB family nutrient-binding outer membrane lipoprotein [Dyadobacter jiangsuensis]PSL27855.1 SusD-like starch-binding protein associating with outer membrane [Dyadobacter jiangsuensis]